ncbi:MAG: lasso peptide biosynthesis B2 protein [Haloechinothrix sp.]
MPMAINESARSTRAHAGAATFALVVVHIALRTLGFDRTQRLTRHLMRTTRRIADADRVLRALAATDAAAAWVPFRVACLERSLAAQLLLIARRQATEWRVGVRAHPLAMHAWLTDAAGAAIGEPVEPVGYQPLVAIRPDHPRGDAP